ncbi:MAG TPA: YiiX family permuted papain-like enzyme [Steroidobacteraceae bacterium]|nr:YiiX family permuted papain-like enzyme [Steroidobacteraceae bacterium]
MKRALATVLCVLVLLLGALPTQAAVAGYVPRAGDLVFQISGSAQAEAVRLATGATYGHVGVVFMVDGVPRVLEAGGDSVRYSSLQGFIARSRGGKYAIKRLKNAGTALTAEHIRRMQAMGESWRGRGYDKVFSWSDAEMYCTELVWKLYQRVTGIELGRVATIGEFDLRHPGVQKFLKERYGDRIPVEETVISPAELFRAPGLEIVFEAG